MRFDYTELKVLIRKKYKNYLNFSKKIGWTPSKLERKLNGRSELTSEDIYIISNDLGIEGMNMERVFFTLEVAK